jgi:preprotein translocase subunit SecY
MMEKFNKVWGIKQLRANILFVLGMLVIFRFVAHIPIPGVDRVALASFLGGNQVLGLLNVFSGGTIENFSLVMLGIAPYITSSIIFQLLAMVVPKLEEMSKEGESGQKKISMYTRLATVPLALLQAYGFISLLSRSHGGVISDTSAMNIAVMMLTVTAGTVFLMWMGELITERKIGNGISLLIFASIISSLPTAVRDAVINYNSSQLYTYLLFVGVAILTTVGVIIISEGQRNIPVNYAKQSRPGSSGGLVQSHLPLRVNMAGVIPIIFAISIILFPPIVAQFFVGGTGYSAQISLWIINVFNNQLVYAAMYFVLVFGFTYFYTAVIFHPEKMAENLQKQGGFIPGIRPGKQTEEYLGKIMSRLVLVGAVFLSIIAVLPLIMTAFTGSQSLVVGGTSLLIVVSVAIETAKQIEAQVTVHEYDRI